MASKPDVLLVVMDCARADIFNEQLARGLMPFLASLRSETLSFDGAISPASWTLPSHASLFTGLYPWEHGVHSQDSLELSPTVTTLPERLSAEGYASGCFAANGYWLNPGSSITRGFARIVSGVVPEFFLRYHGGLRSPLTNGDRRSTAPSSGDRRESPHSAQDTLMASLMASIPSAWDALNRVAAHAVRSTGWNLPYVCPWISDALGDWLGEVRSNQPVFAFVNLMEAHEPYFAAGGGQTKLLDWLGYARHSTDPYGWRKHGRVPTKQSLSLLRSLYASTYQALDDRIASLVSTFSSHRDWDNTLFILTSDHGQAFLEDASMFHGFHLDEAVTRVPLWLRAPWTGVQGTAPPGWVSLTEVTSTIRACTTGRVEPDTGPGSLLRTPGARKGGPVFSMSNGVPSTAPLGDGPSHATRLGDLQIAAYQGECKGLLDETGRFRACRVSPRSIEPCPSTVETGPERDAILAVARGAMALALSRVPKRPQYRALSDRLAAWGY